MEYERSVNHLERAAKHDGRPEADARREDRRMETVKPGMNGAKEPKEKALSLAVAQIERQFGKGAIMRLGAQPAALDIAVIPTGAYRTSVRRRWRAAISGRLGRTPRVRDGTW
jgi:hypothetical protein